MNPQERPPTPAELTPGEALLLGYLRQGAFDAELAVRLGLTVGQVKERVAALMARAGVSSRPGLMAWDGAAVEANLPVAGTTELSPAAAEPVPAGPAWPAERLKKLGLQLAPLAALAGLVVAGGWWFATADDGGDAVTAVVAARPVDTPVVPAPAVAAQAGPRRQSTTLAVGAAGALPSGVAFYVLKACDGCSVPGSELVRTYRDADGKFREDSLLRPAEHGAEAITAAWAADDASEMVMALCLEGSCGPGDAGNVTSDARMKVLRSIDGGVTWEAVGEFAASLRPIGIVEGEVLAQRWVRSGAGNDGLRRDLVLLPSGRTMTVPPGAAANRPPFVVHEDTVAFHSSDGEAVVDLAGDTIGAWLPGEPKRLVQVHPRMTADTWAFRWYQESPTPDRSDIETKVGEAQADGTVRKLVSFIGSPLRLGPWLGAHSMVAMIDVQPWDVVYGDRITARYTRVPAILDFDRATVTPIEEPLGEGFNEVVAARSGNFLRVDGERCAPVKAGPGAGAAELACIAPGTLASVVRVQMIDYRSWLVIRTASGRDGWVESTTASLTLITACGGEKGTACGRALSAARGEAP